MERYGIHQHSNGDIYEGNWKNLYIMDFRTYIFTDVQRYIGKWVNYKIHGKCKYLDMNNNIGWLMIFKDRNYHSKEQSNSKKSKISKNLILIL